MASVSKSSVFFLLSYLVLLCSAKDDSEGCTKTTQFDCGRLRKLGFPFFSITSNPDCGVFIEDCDKNTPTIQLAGSERSYEAVSFSWPDVIRIKDQLLPGKCESLTNLSLPSFPFIYLEIITPNQTLYKCNRSLSLSPPEEFKKLHCKNDHYEIYNSRSQNKTFPNSSNCSIIQLPMGYTDRLKPFEFEIRVRLTSYCWNCHLAGGNCQHRNGGVHCDKGTYTVEVIKRNYLGCTQVWKMNVDFFYFWKF